MNSDRISLILAVTLLMIISSCVSTMVSSVFIIKRSDENLVYIGNVRKSIEKKFENAEIPCRNINDVVMSYECYSKIHGQYYKILFVDSSKRNFYVKLSKTYMSFFPLGKDRIYSGNYISDEYRELEQWILSLMPEIDDVKMIRTFNDYKDGVEIKKGK